MSCTQRCFVAACCVALRIVVIILTRSLIKSKLSMPGRFSQRGLSGYTLKVDCSLFVSMNGVQKVGVHPALMKIHHARKITARLFAVTNPTGCHVGLAGDLIRKCVQRTC